MFGIEEYDWEVQQDQDWTEQQVQVSRNWRFKKKTSQGKLGGDGATDLEITNKTVKKKKKKNSLKHKFETWFWNTTSWWKIKWTGRMSCGQKAGKSGVWLDQDRGETQVQGKEQRRKKKYIYIFKWSLSFGDKNIFHFTFKKNSVELPLEAGDSYWLFDTKPRFKSRRKALRQRTLKWTVKDTLKHVKKLYVDLLIEPTQTSGGFNSTKNVALFKFWSYFVL